MSSPFVLRCSVAPLLIRFLRTLRNLSNRTPPMRVAALLLTLWMMAVSCESPEEATRARFQERLKTPATLTHAEVNQFVTYTLAAVGGRPVRVREQGAVRALDAKGRAEVLA